MPAHTVHVRVRYAETDQMGVAHHAAWVPWFELARIEWLRAHGHSYRELEAAGVAMPVIELGVRYRQPARFDDEIALTTEAVAVPPSRVRFRTRAERDGRLLAEAEVVVASVDAQGRPTRLPPALLAIAGLAAP